MNPNAEEDGVLGGFQTLCVTTSEHSSGIAPQSATFPQQRWPLPMQHSFSSPQWPLNMSAVQMNMNPAAMSPPVVLQPFNSLAPQTDPHMFNPMQAQPHMRIPPPPSDRLYTPSNFAVAPSMYSVPAQPAHVVQGPPSGSVFVNGRWIHYGKVPDVQSLSNENSPNQSPNPSSNFQDHTLADYVNHYPPAGPSAIVVDPVWPFIQPTGPNQSLSSLNGTCYSTSTSHLHAPSNYDDHPSSLSVQSYNTSPNHGSPASRSHSPAAYVDDDGVTTVNALVEGKFIPEPSDVPTHARRNSISHIIYDPLTIAPTYTNYNSGHHPGSMTARGRPSHFDDPWQQYRDPSQSFSSQASTGSTRSSVSSRAVSAASDLDDVHSERSDAVDNPSRATSNSLSQSHDSPRRNESTGSLGGTTRSRSGSKRRRAPALAATSELDQDVGPGTVAPSSSPSNSPRAARQDSDGTGAGDDDDSPRSHSSKRARSRGKSRPRAAPMVLSRQQETSLLGAEQVDPRRYAIHSTNPKKSKVKGACAHHTHVITVRERRVRMVLINGVELMSSGAFTGQCMVRIRVADKSTTTGDRAATVFAWNYYETQTEVHSNGKDIIIDLPRMGSRLIKASPRAVEAARCNCDIALFKLEILLPTKPDSGRRSAFIPALVTTR